MRYSLGSLIYRPGRLLAGVASVALPALFILCLLALAAGTFAQYTSYPEHTGADLFVTQRGAATLLQPSLLPAQAGEEVARTEGVEAVAALLGQVVRVTTEGKALDAYLVGLDPGRDLGRPWAIEAWSRSARPGVLRRGEAIVDAELAGQLGVRLDDQVATPGRTLKIAALSRAAGYRYPLIYVGREDAAVLLGVPDRYNFLLVRLRPGVDAGQVAARINAAVPEASAYPRAAFLQNAVATLEDSALPAARLALGVAIVVGAILIALAFHAAALDRSPELTTLRAIGAGRRQLYGFFLRQVAVIVALGLGLALLLAELLALFFAGLGRDVVMRLDPGTALAGLALGLALAAVGAVLPVRWLVALDPAAAFRA